MVFATTGHPTDRRPPPLPQDPPPAPLPVFVPFTPPNGSMGFFTSLRTLKLKTKQQELLIRVSALALIYILAFAVHLFSILRYESMIHEFDPYFNYRTTLFLTKNGFYEFWNWFDAESWYPLGRIIGGTLFPGLMVTAALIYRTLRFLTFADHIREVCILTAPFYASNTTLVAYFFGKEIWDTGAGLAAAAIITICAICPGYISRSIAGSYDNEGVAIFALLLTFYFFVKAVNTVAPPSRPLDILPLMPKSHVSDHLHREPSVHKHEDPPLCTDLKAVLLLCIELRAKPLHGY